MQKLDLAALDEHRILEFLKLRRLQLKSPDKKVAALNQLLP